MWALTAKHSRRSEKEVKESSQVIDYCGKMTQQKRSIFAPMTNASWAISVLLLVVVTLNACLCDNISHRSVWIVLSRTQKAVSRIQFHLSFPNLHFFPSVSSSSNKLNAKKTRQEKKLPAKGKDLHHGYIYWWEVLFVKDINTLLLDYS